MNGYNSDLYSYIPYYIGVDEMRMSSEAEEYVQSMNKYSKIEFLSQVKLNNEPSEINFVDNSVPDQSTTPTTPVTPTSTPTITTIASETE